MLEQLKLMPYNAKARGDEDIPDHADISSDRASDLPLTGWDIPESLTKVHVYRMARMWIDWART